MMSRYECIPVIVSSGEFRVICLSLPLGLTPEVLKWVTRPSDVHTMSSPSPHTDADTTDDGRPTLAQELLDLILDHLHNDSESLKQSALASKSLLSTCQRHLFSTYQITKFKLIKLAELFASPSLNDGNDEGASLRARVTDLLNTYTTNLILTDYPRPFSGYGMKKAHLPEFKNVQKITFKGDGLNSAIVIPPFLMQTWMASSPRLRSVEFDFLQIHEKAILESFYLIPSTVEEVSFIYATTEYGRRSRLAASLVREGTEDQLLPVNSSPGVYYPSGTPNLEDLLPIILELKDLFKFSLKRLSYRPTDRASIDHLGSLVDECKNTLQFLDITVSHSGAYMMQRTVASSVPGYNNCRLSPLSLLRSQCSGSTFRFFSPPHTQAYQGLDFCGSRSRLALRSYFLNPDAFEHNSKSPAFTDRNPHLPPTPDDVPEPRKAIYVQKY